MQSVAPLVTGGARGKIPNSRTALWWAVALTIITVCVAVAMGTGISVEIVLITGLFLFGAAFAINSSIHSYLIVSYAREDGVSLDVGFYYMANAMGRLIGTLLSGWIYQTAGIVACLWVSALFIFIAAVISIALPKSDSRKCT